MTDPLEYRLFLTVLIGAVVLTLSVGMATAVAGETGIIIEQSDSNGTVYTYEVIVQNASGGIGGYEFAISLTDSENAEITNIHPGVDTGNTTLFTSNISPNRTLATVSAVYLTQENPFESSSPVILRVEITGEDADTAEIETNLDNSNSEFVMIIDSSGKEYTIVEYGKLPKKVSRFDINENDEIDRSEVINAINVFYTNQQIGGEQVSRLDVVNVINAYYTY